MDKGPLSPLQVLEGFGWGGGGLKEEREIEKLNPDTGPNRTGCYVGTYDDSSDPGRRTDSLASPCGYVNDFVLSLLPELGTLGSKRGGVGVTRSSTS